MTIFSTELNEEQDLIYYISKTVAERTDTDIRDLPPMYEAIDPGALDAFLGCSDGSDTRHERSIEFLYGGYQVTADSTGRVRLNLESATGTKPSIRG